MGLRFFSFENQRLSFKQNGQECGSVLFSFHKLKVMLLFSLNTTCFPEELASELTLKLPLKAWQ